MLPLPFLSSIHLGKQETKKNLHFLTLYLHNSFHAILPPIHFPFSLPTTQTTNHNQNHVT
jgi:hypothetical protein